MIKLNFIIQIFIFLFLIVNAGQASTVTGNEIKILITNYLDNKNISSKSDEDQTKPTLGFQRVLQRALFQVQASGKSEVTGANVLLAIYSEYGSHAVRFLTQEGVTRLDILSVIGNQFDSIDQFPDQQAGIYPDNLGDDVIVEPMAEESSIEKYAVNLNQRARDGKIEKIIGRSTSGNYSFNFKKNLTFGYINNDFTNEELQNKNLFIEVEKKKYPIKIIYKPLKQTNFKNN